MLTNFFYSHATWVVAIVVIGIWTGLSLLGLVIFNKFSSAEHRHKDTETVGLTYAIVAVVYAVLIGFIVVNVFESSAKGDEIATTEANRLSALKLDSVGLSEDESKLIRASVNKYLDIVVAEGMARAAGRQPGRRSLPARMDAALGVEHAAGCIRTYDGRPGRDQDCHAGGDGRRG